MSATDRSINSPRASSPFARLTAFLQMAGPGQLEMFLRSLPAPEYKEVVKILEEIEWQKRQEQLKKSKSETRILSLHEFMVEGWHALEPGHKFFDNWHLHAICEHLEALYRLEIKDLIINIPPRHQKSLLVAVFWQAWMWTQQPWMRFFNATYSLRNATRDSVKCRDLVTHPWYQRNWGHLFRLTSDQNEKLKFANDQRGYRLATSISGMGTGEGGDVIAVDDPHKALGVESDVEREKVIRWWTETMPTRFSDLRSRRRVIVMQRLHEHDLSGYCLQEQTGWEHLCIPLRYEDTDVARSRVTSLGWRDPRTTEGQLIDPVRFPEEEIKKLEHEVMAFGTAAQLQQSPVPRKGKMFSRDNFPRVQALPVVYKAAVRYWDKAFTQDGGAYTVGELWLLQENDRFLVVDVVRGQWEQNGRDDVIEATAKWDRAHFPRTVAYIEEEPGPQGRDSCAILIRRLKGYRVKADRPSTDKVLRARPLESYSKAGNVQLLDSRLAVREEHQPNFMHDRDDWNEDFWKEFERFPSGRYKDQVDAGSGAFTKLALPDEEEEETEFIGWI